MTVRERSTDDELECALAALNSGDDAAALAHLLDAWRATPAAALAVAIELVGARGAAGVHAPCGVSEEDREEAWHAAARKGDPVMRHRLLATVTDVRDERTMIARAEQLAGTRDPRVARMLLALATEVRVSVDRHVPEFWRPLYRMLETCGDPRVRTWFLAIDWRPRLRHVAHSRELAFRARIAKVNMRIEAAYPAEPPVLPPQHAAIVAAIAELAGRPVANAADDEETEAALLAAVRAAPADDGPRAIYADWLQERGDPHGELIVLQLATQGTPRWQLPDEQRRRIETLLAQHGERWIGPIAQCLTTSEFERGFLATCEIKWLVKDVERVATPPDPAWATVRSIRGGVPATDEHPMPALRHALELDTPSLERLARLAQPPPLATLGWLSSTDGSDEAAAVAAFEHVLPRLPHLRSLVLDARRIADVGPGELAWPWRGTQLQSLRVTTNLKELPEWFAAVVDSQLAKFAVRSGWNVELERSGALTVDARYSAYEFDERFDALCTALDQLPADFIRTVKFDVSAKDLWTLERRRRMARSLDRHPALTVIEIRGFTRPKQERR